MHSIDTLTSLAARLESRGAELGEGYMSEHIPGYLLIAMSVDGGWAASVQEADDWGATDRDVFLFEEGYPSAAEAMSAAMAFFASDLEAVGEFLGYCEVE